MTTDAPEPSSPRGPVWKCVPARVAGRHACRRAKPIPSEGRCAAMAHAVDARASQRLKNTVGLVLAVASEEPKELRAGARESAEPERAKKGEERGAGSPSCK